MCYCGRTSGHSLEGRPRHEPARPERRASAGAVREGHPPHPLAPCKESSAGVSGVSARVVVLLPWRRVFHEWV